jgi:hypothetical protein
LIRFSLAGASQVSLVVYDLLGQAVVTLVDQAMPAGQHQFTWLPERLASGVYFYRLEAGPLRECKKLLLLQ